MLPGYTRPALELQVFRGDDGVVIPYGERWSGSPPDETYGVETHPERYEPLIDVARSLIEQLSARYGVRTAVGSPDSFEFPERIVETVALVPADSTSATIQIGFTDYPGVMINAGAGVDFVFPSCGCDACDEGVIEQIEELENVVEGVVTGGLTLAVDGREGYWLEWSSGGRGSLAGFDRAESRFPEAAGTRRMAPWRER